MADPDVAAMLSFQRGDHAAFEGLVARHTDTLVNFFFFQCRDRSLAEDCCQEVWLKLFRSRDDYQPRARFKTFLLRVARNHWIDRFRSQARRPSETPLETDTEEDQVSPRDHLAAEAEDAAAGLHQEDAARVLARALNRLPEEMREVYLLGEVEQLPYAEVSEILKIPVGTVKSRMFNAVRKLQEILRRFGEEA